MPIEQYRGIEKIKLVDFINDPRLKNMDVPLKGDLPGLYHPRQGNQAPWIEMSMGALLMPTEGFVKKFMAKSSFKGNLAGLDIFTRWTALFFDAEAFRKKQEVWNHRSGNMPKKSKSMERKTSRRQLASETIQAIPPDSGALGKMAQ